MVKGKKKQIIERNLQEQYYYYDTYKKTIINIYCMTGTFGFFIHSQILRAAF